MTIYLVKQITCFGDFEVPQASIEVSPYFKTEESAEKYMHEHFDEKDYNGAWATIYVAKKEIEILD